MEMSLYQKQSQGLIMTTQMKQAMHMLRCSVMELNDYVLEFAVRNPFVEVEPVDIAAFMPVPSAIGAGHPAPWRHDASRSMQEVAAAKPSLIERLQFQLHISGANKALAAVTEHLIGSLDTNGYVTEDLDTVSNQLCVPESLVKEAFDLLQSFDPPGIGARNLRECLQLQLGLVPEHLQSLAAQVIAAHLEAVADGKVAHLAKILNVPVLQVQRAIDAIRRLDPRPGIADEDSETQYVVPDAVVERSGDAFVVVTNEKAEPFLRLNPSLVTLFRQPQDAKTHAYLVQQLQEAKWLMHCLEQRRSTLRRVLERIVEFQQPYFHSGPSQLRPLTMRQVGEILGLHESTVSRAVRGKYLQTSFGVRPLRYFFSAGLTSTATDGKSGLGHSTTHFPNDGSISAEAVRERIRIQIHSEDSKCPLSDAQLARLLATEGIRVARRTIAKYREEMGIPPSYRRRRFE